LLNTPQQQEQRKWGTRSKQEEHDSKKKNGEEVVETRMIWRQKRELKVVILNVALQDSRQARAFFWC
jgi:hypothetical protein